MFKKLFLAFVALCFALPAHAAPTTKQKCVVVKGKKQCKTIKIHKKHTGKKVPAKKAGK